MPADRDLWLLGPDADAAFGVAAAASEAVRSVTRAVSFDVDLVAWGAAGWPLLVAVVEPGTGAELLGVLEGLRRARLVPPILAVLHGDVPVAPLVAAGVTDVLRWPGEADMLVPRLQMLAARSVGEPHVRGQIVGAPTGALYVFDYGARKVVWVSPDAEAAIGLEATALLHASDRALAEMIHPDDVPYLRQRIVQNGLARDGEALLSEYRFRAGSGWRWLQLHSLVLDRTSAGTPHRIVGVARDATPLRAAEEALRTLVQGTAEVGEGFFRSLARELAHHLGVRYVLVGEIRRGEGEVLASRAFWGDGAFQEPVEFSIPGSAVEEVGTGRPVFHPSGVREAFPADLLLERLGVDAVLGVPVRDGTGSPIGMILVWNDQPFPAGGATRTLVDALAARAGAELERAHWDAALRTEEERLRLATTAARAGVWDWNVVTDELVWKGEADTIFGDPAVAASRSTGAFWDRIHPDDVRRGRSAFQHALDGDDRVHVDLRFVRKDGETRWIACRGEVSRDAGGRPVRMTGTAVDVTDRKLAEERVRGSEERLKLALGGAKAGIWDWGFVTGVLYYSPEWEQMIGYAPGTLAPTVQTWKDLVHPDDREPVGRALVAHLKGQTEIYETEHRLRHRDGSWVWVLDRGKVVERSPDGRAVRMTGFQSDISDRKRLETQLLLADRMSTVGTLAKGIAHEVNNPLAYVVGNLEHLVHLSDTSGAPPNPRFRRALADAIEGAERVRAVIADLKTFSRTEDDTPRVLDVHQVVDSALRIVHNELRHQARLEKRFAARRPVLGSEGKLAQVFVNLVSNALQAMPPGRSSDENLVRVSTTEDGRGFVVVEVEDNGVGMSGEVMRRIFDPFFTTRPVGEATGLGLTACHNVVAAMGGRLEVESAVGAGSRFRVVLPAAPAEAVQGAAAPWVSAAPPTTRPRVLVIDDEPMVAGVVEAMLGDAHEVVKVESAAAGLAALRAGQRFDAVLCDLMMPSMTGMAFFDELIAGWPELAAHTGFVTGGAFTRAALDFMHAMPDRCIEKPFDGPTLRRFVAWLVTARAG